MQRTYVPGSWTFLAGADLVLFTDAGPDTLVVKECWQLIDGGATVDDVLGVIVHEGLRAIGAFVLASRERVLVRGDVSVARGLGAEEWQAVGWEPTPTWCEIAFDAPVMRLIAPETDADMPVLPLSQGIVLASVVVFGQDHPASDEVPTEKDSVRKTEDSSIGASGSPPIVVAVPAKVPEPPPSTPKSGMPPNVEQQQPVNTSVDESNGESRHYDELFTPSTKASATPGIETTVQLAPVRTSTSPRPAARSEPPPSYVTPTPSPAPTPAGFIDHLPWAPVGRAAATPPRPVMSPEPGATLQRPPRTAGHGVLVQAVRCPAGHPNPVAAGRCRVCRAPITDRKAIEVDRPRLGVLRLSTDPEPIALERGVVFGREPTTQSDVDRIALRRPDISANHVEVRLEGWQVLVVDLGSTNGTVVTGPDGGSAKLTPHVPVELHHGTEVAVSDEISFRFEVTP